MATPSVLLSVTTNGEQPQSGAASGAAASYRLQALEQPRFFYGQLLTDQDLNVLLAWAQGRLRLARHREGWGVVCGLELRRDPQQDGRVIIGPGYAVSASGDDIVVPADSDSFDLSKACADQPVDCAKVKQDGDDAAREKIKLGSREYYKDELRFIDIFLRYQEVGASPQTALGRRVSGQTEVCEPSRTLELYERDYAVTCEAGPSPSETKTWHAGYSAIWAELSKLSGKVGADRRSALLAAIGEPAKTPIRSFPLIMDLIEQARESQQPLGDEDYFLALFYLIQDRHNAYLAEHCRCRGASGDPGVPLGRLRVQVRSVSGVPRCHILDIDAAPPFRRLFGPDALPAPLGKLNLGQLIWRRAVEARAFLKDHGIAATFTDRPLPDSAQGLAELFACPGVEEPLFVGPDDAVRVRTVMLDESDDLSERVVAICRASSEDS